MAALIPMAAVAASTALSAVGKAKAGISAKRAAYKEAAQLDARAKTTRASATRDAIEQRRQAQLLESRALAVAAAGGGGASDQNVTKTISDIAGEGEYRALTDMYNGNESALGDEAQAEATRSAGRQAKTAGWLGAATTVLDGASKMWGMKK